MLLATPRFAPRVIALAVVICFLRVGDRGVGGDSVPDVPPAADGELHV